MNYCLNKDTKLYYIRNPVSDKAKLSEGASDYVKCLNPNDFMSVMPKFSKDFSRLMYFSATDKFISHSGYYQLKYFKWPVEDS